MTELDDGGTAKPVVEIWSGVRLELSSTKQQSRQKQRRSGDVVAGMNCVWSWLNRRHNEITTKTTTHENHDQNNDWVKKTTATKLQGG